MLQFAPRLARLLTTILAAGALVVPTLASADAATDQVFILVNQQRASHDKDLPGLSDVFAAFGSWKRARREAATTG